MSSSQLGDWHFYAQATHTIELSRQVLPSEAAVDRADYADGPLKWRGNLGIDWSNAALSAGWNMQYYHSYRVCSSTLDQYVCQQQQLSQGSDRIPGQFSHDIYVKYSFMNDDGPLKDLDIRFNVNNVFNDGGPTIASAVTYTNGPASFNDPRLRRFNLSLHKRF